MSRNGIETEIIPLDEMFRAYCSMDPTSRAMDVELLPLSQSDKCLQTANVLDMNSVTTTDTGLCFFKFRKRAIDSEEFLKYIEDLAKLKQLDLGDVQLKLQTSVKPIHPLDKKKRR